jgi:phage tail tape-measure protein
MPPWMALKGMEKLDSGVSHQLTRSTSVEIQNTTIGVWKPTASRYKRRKRTIKDLWAVRSILVSLIRGIKNAAETGLYEAQQNRPLDRQDDTS